MAENKEESKNPKENAQNKAPQAKENAQNKAPQNQRNKTADARNNGPPNAQNKAKEILHNKQKYIEKKKPGTVGKDAETEEKGSGQIQQQLQNRFTMLEIEETQDEDEVEEIQTEEKLTRNIETPVSILRRGQYSMPPALQYLLKDTENFRNSFIKRCSVSMNLTDIDKPRDNNTPTIQELKDFRDNIRIPEFKKNQNEVQHGDQEDMVIENIEGEEYEDHVTQNEDFTEVINRRKKNYVKDPELQRSTRSSTKSSQTDANINIQ